MMTGTPVLAATLVLLLLIRLAVDAREPFACDPKDQRTRSFPFCRASLPIPKRVRDLVGRLTLQEKVKLLTSDADAVPRLGIGGYEWWSEALHGVSYVGPGTKFGGDFPGATSFPQVITTAASFNVSLWEAIGQVVSDEARAMYNGGMGGLTYWSPNVNILQDPRWGRGQETPGEDPLVVGRYAASHVRGLQGGDGGIRLKVAACCKSFTAYSLDNWNGVNRLTFNARVSKQDMEDTFSVPFEMCVMEGKVASVMCSYNQVNGVPTCADPNLLKKTVRGAWHLDGYIVSECDSVEVLYNRQHYTSTPQQAVAHAIKAGLDLNCGSFLAQHTEEAVRGGLLNETEVDGALLNTLTVQMRLGMFDGEPSAQAYGTLGPKDVCTLAHQELALEAARQGIVLLKNLQLALPLSPSRHRTVAVIGPNSNVTKTMIGNYEGSPCGFTTPLQGIGNYTKTIHQQGCADVGCSDNGLFGEAIEAARSSDATVLVMGLDQSIEREDADRDSLFLPGQQQELVSKVATASKGPTVLVLMSGGPIDISFANIDPRVAAILWAGYPGQAGGAAIADILFGATNPGGRLPMTWYPEDYLARAPMTAMDMRPTVSYPGRTYRFYEGPVVYPFGYGLSYTRFVHAIVATPAVVAIPLNGRRPANANMTLGKAVKVAHARCAGLLLVVQLDVRNAGARDGPETVLTYSTPPRDGGAGWVPRKQLVGFHRVHVAAGASERVRINIHACKYLSVVDRSGIRRIPMGEHRLQIGDVKHSVLLRAETSGGI